MSDSDFAQLRRSPFGGGDLNAVFGQLDSISSVPVSAAEDIGITPEMVAFIRQGIYNGDFRTPPPDTASNLDDVTNKLPGWSFVQSVGTLVTAKWVTDGSGGSIRFTLAAGTNTSCTSYIEQIIPIAALTSSRVVYTIRATHDGSSANFTATVKSQYLDAAGATTGTESSSADWSQNSPLVSTPNGETGAPADATFLRVRVGITQQTTSGDSIDIDYVYMTDRLVIPGVIAYQVISSSEDDYSRTGTEHAQVWAITASGGSWNITGIDSTGMSVGRVLWIYNFGSSNNIVLKHENASSSASNRILGPNNTDMTILPRGSVMLMWFGDEDDAVLRWRLMSGD